MEKLYVSAYGGHLQILTTFLLKEFYIICLKRVVILKSYYHIFIVVFLTEFTSPYSLNTQPGMAHLRILVCVLQPLLSYSLSLKSCNFRLL